MVEWLGSGLPPSALARMQAANASHLRFSELSVAGQLAVESCGLVAVGPVVGCTAKWLDWGEFGLGDVGCGYDSSRKDVRARGASHVTYAAPAYVGTSTGRLGNLVTFAERYG